MKLTGAMVSAVRVSLLLALLPSVDSESVASTNRQHLGAIEFMHTKLTSSELMHTELTSSLRQRLKAPPTDVAQVVATLGEVVKGVEEEDSKNKARRDSLKAAFKESESNLKAAVTKAERTIRDTTEDLATTKTQTDDMETAISGLKEQIAASNTELDKLQTKLKELREANKESGLLQASALAQLNHALANAQAKSEEETQPLQTEAPERQDVAELEELSTGLSASSGAPLSFLQRRASSQDLLWQDREALVNAHQTSLRDFNEEENNLLELIRLERKKLGELERSLEDQQPTLASKIQQGAEQDQTLVSAKRGLERDQKLLATLDKKRTMMLASIEAQRNIRLQVSDELRMAVKMLETMDTSMFLSQDVHGLQRPEAMTDVPVSFVQVRAHSKAAMDTDLQDAVMDTLAQSAPQSGDIAAQAGQVMSLLATASDASNDASLSDASSSAGPFDQVTDMIKALMASLKDQVNGAANKEQFCQDNMVKNRQERTAKKATIDTKSSQMRFAQTAILRLDDDLAFLATEISRLEQLAAAAKKELEDEKARVDAEKEDHRLAKNIINEVSSVLTQLCELDPPALLQTSLRTKSSLEKLGTLEGTTVSARAMTQSMSKFEQCGEAVKMLGKAVSKFDEQDSGSQSYMSEFTTISTEEKGDAEESTTERKTQETTAKADRAQRADDLATAEGDLKSAQSELALIAKAKEELDKDCGPGTETYEDRKARRDQEIEALKSAFDVLDGEAIPA
jgi:hypothetical protein